MNQLQIAIVVLFGVLMIAAAMLGYRRTRKGIENLEVAEVFAGDDLTRLRLSLRSWMVPRVEKRLRKLGWELADCEPAASDCAEAIFAKSDDPDAQPLSVVLHRLNRSGFITGGQIDLRKAGP